VGDVITCSAEGALSYRWTNSGDEETYGKTLSISQPGSFNYECSVFVECGTGAICPFTKNISGFARGIAPKLNVVVTIKQTVDEIGKLYCLNHATVVKLHHPYTQLARIIRDDSPVPFANRDCFGYRDFLIIVPYLLTYLRTYR